jgi:hypothetical protein
MILTGFSRTAKNQLVIFIEDGDGFNGKLLMGKKDFEKMLTCLPDSFHESLATMGSVALMMMKNKKHQQVLVKAIKETL